MEAVVSENVDRQNFDPIEEAYAVQALVAEFGSNRAVAQHFDRVDGWVTQRVLLTHLAREVQDLVRQKAMPLEAARSLGKLSRDNDWSAADQLKWWEEEQERRAAATAARAAAKKAAKQSAPVVQAPADVTRQAEPPSFTAVKLEPTASQATPVAREQGPISQQEPERTVAAVAEPQPMERQDGIPEPRPATPQAVPLAPPQPKRFPYDNGAEAAHHLITKMSEEEFRKMLHLLNEHDRQQASQAG
jgi:ParB family chromosome partitioning protein